MLDLKYKPEDIILEGKVGEDNFVGVVMSAKLARENGIDVPKMGKSQPEEKAESKKKK